MQEPPVAAGHAAAYGRCGRALLALTRAFAVAGGLVFVGLVAMEIVSIVGRKLWAWSVPGDVELLEMCAAFAAATFFAYCHLAGGDVKVDFFTHNLPPRIVAALDSFGSLLVAAFGALIAWRTGAGAWSVHESGVTSAILGIPVWIAQGLMVPSFVLLAVSGGYRCAILAGAAARPAERTR
ncbi:MAG: TRAP transporter small permease [Burkholderiales bacterium]|jgi:TRAP-type C4-dicarboxylate transport system permease small subunit|nr:TRAP transporter small permease [Burkholderiales bacterium]